MADLFFLLLLVSFSISFCLLSLYTFRSFSPPLLRVNPSYPHILFACSCLPTFYFCLLIYEFIHFVILHFSATFFMTTFFLLSLFPAFFTPTYSPSYLQLFLSLSSFSFLLSFHLLFLIFFHIVFPIFHSSSFLCYFLLSFVSILSFCTFYFLLPSFLYFIPPCFFLYFIPCLSISPFDFSNINILHCVPTQ